MAFYKISDDPDTSFKDIQIHGRKYIANFKSAVIIGSDAAQTFEMGIKTMSVPIPTNKKIRLVKINWSSYLTNTVTFTSAMEFINPELHLKYDNRLIMVVSSEDKNDFTNTLADADGWLARQAEKFYVKNINEHYEMGTSTLYYNSEIFNQSKEAFLNLKMRFGFKAATVYADYNAGLLQYYKTLMSNGVTGAVPYKFTLNAHIEMDILSDRPKMKSYVPIKKKRG